MHIYSALQNWQKPPNYILTDPFLICKKRGRIHLHFFPRHVMPEILESIPSLFEYLWRDHCCDNDARFSFSLCHAKELTVFFVVTSNISLVCLYFFCSLSLWSLSQIFCFNLVKIHFIVATVDLSDVFPYISTLSYAYKQPRNRQNTYFCTLLSQKLPS